MKNSNKKFKPTRDELERALDHTRSTMNMFLNEPESMDPNKCLLSEWLYGVCQYLREQDMTGPTFVQFVRKPAHFRDYQECIQKKYYGPVLPCQITKTIKMSVDEFQEFTNNFYKNQQELLGNSGGVKNGLIQVIKILGGNFTLYVNTEGFNYARYVGFEINKKG